MNIPKALTLIAFVISIAPASAFCANSGQSIGIIEVFHSNQHKLSGLVQLEKNNIEVTLYNLDAPLNMEKQLTSSIRVKGKTADQLSTVSEIEAAKQLVKQQIDQLNKRNQFESLWRGLLLAKHYDLKRYPAIVFNRGESVIYGMTDIDAAVQLKHLSEKMVKDDDH